MAPEEKPYRVYRGGRRGPKLPKLALPSRKPAASPSGRNRPRRPPRSRARVALKWAGIVFSVFLL